MFVRRMYVSTDILLTGFWLVCCVESKPRSLTALLKHIRTSIAAILLITTLMITVTTSIQPVFAPRECGNCGEFLKLTAQFEKAVIGPLHHQKEIRWHNLDN